MINRLRLNLLLLQLLFASKYFILQVWILFWKLLNGLRIVCSFHESDFFVFDLYIFSKLSNLFLKAGNDNLLMHIRRVRSWLGTKRTIIESFKSLCRRKEMFPLLFLCLFQGVDSFNGFVLNFLLRAINLLLILRIYQHFKINCLIVKLTWVTISKSSSLRRRLISFFKSSLPWVRFCSLFLERLQIFHFQYFRTKKPLFLWTIKLWNSWVIVCFCIKCYSLI